MRDVVWMLYMDVFGDLDLVETSLRQEDCCGGVPVLFNQTISAIEFADFKIYMPYPYVLLSYIFTSLTNTPFHGLSITYE